MPNELLEVKKLLKSISIKAFIKYYKEFEKKYENSELIKLFKKNEDWNESSYSTIISCGNKIFHNKLNTIALIHISTLNKKLDEETKYNAKKYLTEINNKFKKEEINYLTEEEMYWDLKNHEEEIKIITGK